MNTILPLLTNDGKDTRITSSLSDLGSEPHWRGEVDTLTERRIGGWVISNERLSKPVKVDIVILGVNIATIECAVSRPKVNRAVRIKVKSGFEFNLNDITPETAKKLLSLLNRNLQSIVSVNDLVKVQISGSDVCVPIGVNIPHQISIRDDLAATMNLLQEIIREHSDKELFRVRDELLLLPLDDQNERDIKVIAYYLPQFHPFPENNEWWGPGFTEWTNVAAAKPYFRNHEQPRLPADLGYYDLRLEQVQRDQIKLAQKYGVSGFCYYYYWFSGETLMTLPIDRHVEKDLDIDFCICWANENWTRRWDGAEHEVLKRQNHTLENDKLFIRSCLPYFRSKRYITIDGAPLLQVYRISLLAEPMETIAEWKRIVKSEGFPDLHVCMVESFDLKNPADFGCDSSCQFPPHGVRTDEVSDKVERLVEDFKGKIYSYSDVVRNEISAPNPPHLRFRTAMPSWDNTSRKGKSGNVFTGSSPELFKLWLQHLAEDVRRRLPFDRRFIFVNAWNEWAEGAHLEPDAKNRHANLRAVQSIFSTEATALLPLLQSDDTTRSDWDELRSYIESLVNTNRALTALIKRDRYDLRIGEELSFARIDESVLEVQPTHQNKFNIESINAREAEKDAPTRIATPIGLSVKGWFYTEFSSNKNIFLALRALRSTSERSRYIVQVAERVDRHDVQDYLNCAETRVGFNVTASLRGVERGLYEIELISPDRFDPQKGLSTSTGYYVVVGGK